MSAARGITRGARRLACGLLSLAAVGWPAVSGAQGPRPTKIAPWDEARQEIQDQVDAALRVERTWQLLGSPDEGMRPETRAVLSKAERDMIDRVIKPKLNAATRCNERVSALGDVLQLERQRQLLGSQSSATTGVDVWEYSARTHWQCAVEAYDRCAFRHDLGMITVLVALAHEAAVSGGEGDEDDFVALARGCAEFELEWETDFVDRWDTGESHGGVRARARIPINLFNALFNADLGQGTVEFLGLHHAKCMRMSYSGVDDVARVVRLTTKLEYAKDTTHVIPDDPIRVNELVIDFVPGRWQGKLTETCNDDPASMPWLNWPDVYVWVNRSVWKDVGESGGTQGVLLPFSAARGEIPGGSLFASRTFRPDAPHTGISIATLWHRPDPSLAINLRGPRAPKPDAGPTGRKPLGGPPSKRGSGR